MSFLLGLTAMGPLGLNDSPVDFTVKNVTASPMVAGRIVQLDTGLSDGDSTSLRFGVNGSGYNHAVLPTAAGRAGKLTYFAVLQVALAAGDSGRARLAGKTKVMSIDSGGSFAVGDEGVVTAAGQADYNPLTVGTFAAPLRVVARCEEALGSGAGTESLRDAFFNGVFPAFR